MFYRIKEGKLYDWADYKYDDDCLETDIITKKELDNDNDKALVIVDGLELVLNPDYEAEQVTKRQEDFESNFFLITGYGWYRKQPKGYSSAIESLNTVFNAVTVLQSLPADYLTFYTAPNFTDEAQCTDEWLIANSFKNQAMTAQDFALFYKTAVTIWNSQEH